MLPADEHPNAISHPANFTSQASPRGPVAIVKGVPTPVHVLVPYVRASLLHLILCLLCGLVGPIYAQAPPPSPESIEFFETHIRPVLVTKCYECHSGTSKKIRGGLRLDTAERMRAGGETGPAVVPNKPDESLLVSALRYQSNEMPPSGKLPDAVINDFVKWISLGAPDPRTEATPMAEKNQKANVKADPRDHWAFKHPQRTAPPNVKHATAARNDIDRF